MPNKPSLSSERFVRNTRGYRTVRVGRSDTRAIVRNVSKSDPPGPAPRKLSPRPPALRSYMSAQPRPAKTEEQVTTKGKGKTKPKDKGKSAEKSSGSSKHVLSPQPSPNRGKKVGRTDTRHTPSVRDPDDLDTLWGIPLMSSDSESGEVDVVMADAAARPAPVSLVQDPLPFSGSTLPPVVPDRAVSLPHISHHSDLASGTRNQVAGVPTPAAPVTSTGTDTGKGGSDAALWPNSALMLELNGLRKALADRDAELAAALTARDAALAQARISAEENKKLVEVRDALIKRDQERSRQICAALGPLLSEAASDLKNFWGDAQH